MKKIDQKYIVAIIISLILGASILGYGYLDYKSKKDALEAKKQEASDLKAQQEQQAAQKKKDYYACVLLAETQHESWWNSSCKNFGVNKRTDGCTLPKYNADQINDKRDKDIQNCVTLYK